MNNKLFDMFSKNESKTKNNCNESLVVKVTRCPQNHPCPSVKVCPVDALAQSGYEAPQVNLDKCIKCGKCVKFCPMGALVLE